MEAGWPLRVKRATRVEKTRSRKIAGFESTKWPASGQVIEPP